MFVFTKTLHLTRSSLLTNVTRSKIWVPGKFRDQIDFSRVPIVDDKDVQESVSRGSGPGGQAAAKTNYAVTLVHLPTKVFVRCEESRSVEKNRLKARDKLHEALDNFINKEESVSSQLKRLERIKKEKTDEKRRKKREEKQKAKLEAEEAKKEANDTNKLESQENVKDSGEQKKLPELAR